MTAESLFPALKAELGGLYTAHLGAADVISDQYVVLSGPPWAVGEEPLSQPSGGFNGQVQITAVTGTTAGVLIMLRRLRDLWSPNLQPFTRSLGDWHVTTSYVRSEALDVDRSLMITGTNRHPAYGVDTFVVAAEPI